MQGFETFHEKMHLTRLDSYYSAKNELHHNEIVREADSPPSVKFLPNVTEYLSKGLKTGQAASQLPL